MLDRWAIKYTRRPLGALAARLHGLGVTADQVSICSFVIGALALPALFIQAYSSALVLILLNRVGDGLDGSLARMTEVSDGGAYLDIVFDFLFYSSVVLGFALADPQKNGLAAAFLLCSFIGTGTSFLAFGIMAERHRIKSIVYPQKGIYYLGGLMEGTETVVFFVLFCLFPTRFPLIASIFAVLCLLTTCTRLVGGYFTLKKRH